MQILGWALVVLVAVILTWWALRGGPSPDGDSAAAGGSAANGDSANGGSASAVSLSGAATGASSVAAGATGSSVEGAGSGDSPSIDQVAAQSATLAEEPEVESSTYESAVASSDTIEFESVAGSSDHSFGSGAGSEEQSPGSDERSTDAVADDAVVDTAGAVEVTSVEEPQEGDGGPTSARTREADVDEANVAGGDGATAGTQVPAWVDAAEASASDSAVDDGGAAHEAVAEASAAPDEEPHDGSVAAGSDGGVAVESPAEADSSEVSVGSASVEDAAPQPVSSPTVQAQSHKDVVGTATTTSYRDPEAPLSASSARKVQSLTEGVFATRRGSSAFDDVHRYFPRERYPLTSRVREVRDEDAPATGGASTSPTPAQLTGGSSGSGSSGTGSSTTESSTAESSTAVPGADATPRATAAPTSTEPTRKKRTASPSSADVVLSERFAPGVEPLEDGAAPSADFSIKGNARSMLFHTSKSRYFAITRAEVWFASEADAESAGFSKFA